MSLFNYGDFVLNSKLKSNYKIDCDGLTDSDYEALAKLVSTKFSFKTVTGIPTGGNKFQKALSVYVDENALKHLIVDDVITTGGSFKRMKRELQSIGIIEQAIFGISIFSRIILPNDLYWVYPMVYCNNLFFD